MCKVEGPSVPADEATLRVFTTRPDTLMGATYVVIAPEHPIAAARCESDTSDAGGSLF